MKKWLKCTTLGFIAFVLAVFAFAGTAQAALIYHSGFEIGDFSEWSGVTGSPSIVELIYLINQDTSSTSSGQHTINWAAQTFTPSTTIQCHVVRLRLHKEGTPTGDVTVSIRATDGSGHPTGVDLAYATMSAVDISTSEGYYFFTLNTTIPLSGSTKYAIVFRLAGGLSGHSIFWHYINDDVLSGGNREWSNDSGSSWNATTQDYRFAIVVLPNTGDYAMRSNTTMNTAYATFNYQGALPNVTFCLYVPTNPGAECKIFEAIQTGPTVQGNIRLTTDRYLKIYDADSLIDTGTTQLELGTWHRIAFGFRLSNIKLWLNGTLECSGTGSFMATQDHNLGISTPCTANLYFDDFVHGWAAVEEDIGDIRVLRASPNAIGEYAQYDVTSGYTYVDEFPADDGDFTEDNGGDAARESYNIEDASTIGIGGSDVVKAINVFIRGDRDGGGATDHMIMVRDNSVDYNSADLDFNGIAWFSWYHEDLPNGGGPWRVDRYDALQIGSYHSGGQDQRVHCMLVMVAYGPGWQPPVSDIKVGAEPIDRAALYGSGFTLVDKNNPANASGTLQNVKVYAGSNLTDLVVGTFYTTNGNTLKCRDSEYIGSVTAGAERTFTSLSIDVETGDYIGCYYATGTIEYDMSGFDGLWWVIGEYIDPNDETTYDFGPGDAMSLYGYGNFDGADISNTPSSKNFGVVDTSTTYWSNGSEPTWPLVDGDAYFTITNNGDQCSITIVATNFTGGVGWTLGTPAENTVRLTAFKEGNDSGEGITLTTSPQAFISGLATNIDWELKFETATSHTDGVDKTSTLTLTATLD